MSVVDAVVFCVLVVGFIFGLMRGFLVQATGLAGLLGGLALAYHYRDPFRAKVVDHVLQTPHGGWIAFATLFVASVFVVVFVSRLVRKVIEKLELGAWDRLLGGLFGVLKAGLICALLLLAIVSFTGDGGAGLGPSKARPVLWNLMNTVARALPQGVRSEVEGFLQKRISPPPPATASVDAE